MIPVLFMTVAAASPVQAHTAPEPAVCLTVSPAAAPKPVLKHQLLPEVRELNPGNPVQWYVRCFAEQQNFFFSKEANADRARYLATPLAKLPVDQLRRYGGSALTQADWAARLDTPDWEVLRQIQTEGTGLVLPELGAFRVLATGLRVRFRGEVARGDFEAAVRTAKTMFAFARHLGEHPTLAANLLGLAVADMALDTLEEMVQQPGCPNLYWALTDLPCLVVELRKGAQGARALVDAELRPLRDDVCLTDAQVEEVVGRLSGRLGFAREQAGRPPRSFRDALNARVEDRTRLGAARARLLDAVAAGGLVQRVLALRVMEFTPRQVILLDEKREFEIRRDEEMKLLALPPWQIETLTPEGRPAGGDGLFADFLPAVREARRVQGRVEQRVAILRHVEALRLYAAGHGGKLPGSLSDVPVPLPADPFTGKPFTYEVAAGTAHIRGSLPRGEEKSPVDNRRYEVTVRK
ncbi:MAG: hypothetical protein JWO38_3199 [Gemmataceae bacterium]|nr:hypothetical protein [Gemmataceae bacterium]